MSNNEVSEQSFDAFLDEQLAPEPEAVPESVEVSSESVEQEESVEAAAPEDSEPAQESHPEDEAIEPQSASPRAQKRIRQLASEKKGLKNENAELASKNEELLALVEQLRKSNELTAQMNERQNAYLGQQEEISKMQNRRNTMLQYGLNPDDTRDAIAFEQMEYKAQLESQLTTLQQQLQEQQNALQVERFNQALDQSLTKRLAGYSVDADLLGDIRNTAYDIAALRGITAGEAAEEAFTRYARILPKRTTKKKAAPVPPAARAVTMDGRSQGVAEEPTDDDFLSMVDKGNFRL